MLINNAVITGSFIVNGVSVTGITGSSELSSSYLALSSSYLVTSASYAVTSASYAQSSASLSIRTGNLEATSSTLVSASSSFAAQSASLSTRLTTDESNFTSLSSSFATTSGSISSRVTVIETSYATTGSNTFKGVQYISSSVNAAGFTTSASLYTDGGLRVSKDSFVSGTAYFNNVVVYGTSSIQYLTSSQVNIGANIINLNTQTPAVRYGGMAVADSGSNPGVTGSMLWDSVNNGWIYTRESGSTYSSGALISGPRSSVQGSEQGTLNNYITKGQGGDHITSSQIIDDGTTVQIPGALQVTGSIVGSSTVTATNGLLIGNGGATATSGYVPKFTGTSTIGNSLVYDNATSVFINATTAPALGSPKFFVKMATANSYEGILVASSSNNNVIAIAHTGTLGLITTNYGTSGTNTNLAFGTNGAAQMALDTTGNLSITDTASFGGQAKLFSRITADATTVGKIADSGFHIWNTTNVGSLSQITFGYTNGSTTNASVYLGLITTNGVGSGYGDFVLGTAPSANVQCVERLRITSAGAATFSSNIIANNNASVIRVGSSLTTLGQSRYLNLTDYYGNTNARMEIGFGYSAATGITNVPALIGFSQTNSGGYTLGDLYFATRSVTSDTAPTVRLTISSGGEATFSSSLTATQGIFNQTKSGTGVEGFSGITLRIFGTNAIGDNTSISFRNNDNINIANITGIIGGDNVAYGSLAFSTRNYFTDSVVEVMRINNRGNVGIGTDSPSYRLHVQDSANIGTIAIGSVSYPSLIYSSASSGEFRFDNRTSFSGFITFYPNGQGATLGSEAMRITSGGELLWNLTADSSAALSGGGVLFRNNSQKYIQIATGIDTDGLLMAFYKKNGAGITNTGTIATSGNSTAYNTTSDYRLKEDLKEIKGLDKVSAIKVYDFKWKGTEDRMDGVIAHELQEVIPNAVYGEKDGEEMQGVDYSKLVPVLVKAIQELSAKVDAQAAEINELKNK
jgi:hypothetical protein